LDHLSLSKNFNKVLSFELLDFEILIRLKEFIILFFGRLEKLLFVYLLTLRRSFKLLLC